MCVQVMRTTPCRRVFSRLPRKRSVGSQRSFTYAECTMAGVLARCAATHGRPTGGPLLVAFGFDPMPEPSHVAP